MGFIKIYKKIISPLFPPCCKYHPTCSAYAFEAIKKYGIIRGGWLAVWRILRCNPWSMGGIDYVPEKFDILGRHRHN
jgi:putative membrane protein insertion efficiency factor